MEGNPDLNDIDYVVDGPLPAIAECSVPLLQRLKRMLVLCWLCRTCGLVHASGLDAEHDHT